MSDLQNINAASAIGLLRFLEYSFELRSRGASDRKILVAMESCRHIPSVKFARASERAAAASSSSDTLVPVRSQIRLIVNHRSNFEDPVVRFPFCQRLHLGPSARMKI